MHEALQRHALIHHGMQVVTQKRSSKGDLVLQNLTYKTVDDSIKPLENILCLK